MLLHEYIHEFRTRLAVVNERFPRRSPQPFGLVGIDPAERARLEARSREEAWLDWLMRLGARQGVLTALVENFLSNLHEEVHSAKTQERYVSFDDMVAENGRDGILLQDALCYANDDIDPACFFGKEQYERYKAVTDFRHRLVQHRDIEALVAFISKIDEFRETA